MPSVSQKINREISSHRKVQQIRVLQTGLRRIDSFLGGFKSATITLVDSSHLFSFELLSMLCVSAVKSFGENVVYVDGGNSVDPYAIASLSKRLGLKADAVLSKIMVARAFTAYQLDSIIFDRLQTAIDEYKPSLLIISSITDLLMDRNVSDKEALAILTRNLTLIEKSTCEHNLITIITKRTRLLSSRASACNEILYKGVGEIIKMKCKKKSIEIHSINRDLVMDYLPLSIHQTTLDDFIGGAQIG